MCLPRLIQRGIEVAFPNVINLRRGSQGFGSRLEVIPQGQPGLGPGEKCITITRPGSWRSGWIREKLIGL